MRKILVNELYLEMTPELEKFVGMMTDRKGLISMEFLRKNLELPHDAKAPPLHSGSIQTKQPNQPYQANSLIKPQQAWNYEQENLPAASHQLQGAQQQQRPGAQPLPYAGAAQAFGAQNTLDKSHAQSLVNKLGQNQPANQQGQYPANQQGKYPANQQGQYPANQQGQYPANQQGQYPANQQSQYPAQTKQPQDQFKKPYDPQPVQGNYSGDLVVDMKRFFRTQRLTNAERFAYFGGETKGVITKQEFFNKVYTMNIPSVTQQQISSLFERLDTNHTGQISEHEFRIMFDDQEEQFEKREVKMTAEMDEQIYQLFREIDTDNSKTISISELARSFAKMGANPTSEEIQKIFDHFDKNGDGSISYQEFKQVMEEKLKKDILHLEGLLSELRNEFRRADIYNKGYLTPQQLAQALVNLGIDIRQEDFLALVQAIDKDNSKTIDIDEFIGFIMSPPENNSFSSEADAAIINIKRSRKPSLIDMMDSYRHMPFNFVASFTRDMTRKLMNLPSSAIKPKLNASGAFYSDLLPNLEKSKAQGLKKTTTKNAAATAEVLTIPSALASEIILTSAKGIPIPPAGDKNVDRDQNIIGREVRAIIFSKTQKKFVSNIITIGAEWDPQTEDVWNFPSRNSNENSVLLRLANFTPTEEYDTGLMLVFDLVLFYKNKNQLLEMSSGWAGVDLQELRVSKPHSLKVQGGSPLRVVNINDADIRSNRTGWRQMVKMVSTKEVSSMLKIEVRAADKLANDIRSDLEFLPPMIILNRNALTILKIHRNYLGNAYREALEKGNEIDLINDVLGRAFRKAIDCPWVWADVVNHWNNLIWPRIKSQDISVAIGAIKTVMRYLYLLFAASEFKFAETDPTMRVDNDLTLSKLRRSLTAIYLDNALMDLNLKPAGSNVVSVSASQSSFKPFNVNELLDDENDATFFDQLKNIKANSSLKQQQYY